MRRPHQDSTTALETVGPISGNKSTVRLLTSTPRPWQHRSENRAKPAVRYGRVIVFYSNEEGREESHARGPVRHYYVINLNSLNTIIGAEDIDNVCCSSYGTIEQEPGVYAKEASAGTK